MYIPHYEYMYIVWVYYIILQVYVRGMGVHLFQWTPWKRSVGCREGSPRRGGEGMGQRGAPRQSLMGGGGVKGRGGEGKRERRGREGVRRGGEFTFGFGCMLEREIYYRFNEWARETKWINHLLSPTNEYRYG